MVQVMAPRQAEGKGRRVEQGKKELRRVIVEEGENGGHIVTHEYKRPESRGEHYMPEPEPDRFPFGEGQGREALDHIASHMGMKVAKEEPKAEAKKESAEEEA